MLGPIYRQLSFFRQIPYAVYCTGIDNQTLNKPRTMQNKTAQKQTLT